MRYRVQAVRHQRKKARNYGSSVREAAEIEDILPVGNVTHDQDGTLLFNAFEAEPNTVFLGAFLKYLCGQ